MTFFFLSLLVVQSAFSQTVGKSIIDRFDRVGVVERIENGRVFYRTSNGFSYDESISGISPETVSPRFPLRGKVIDNFERQGTTDMAFADGRVSYRTSNGFQYVTNNVSPEVPSRGLVRPGIAAIDNFDRIGRIQAVYDNGQAAYRTSNGFEYVSDNVSPAVEENRGIRASDRVIDNFDRIGISDNVFANGKVSYRTSNGFSYVDTSVVREIAQLPNGIRPGTAVIDNFDRVGSTQHAFADGRVAYRTGNGFSYVDKQVSPEVETHERYRKHVEYASNSDIGEVVRFFGNGKIEVHGDNTSICDTLFEEVESIDGIAAESEVVTPDGEGKVENIFANRMARIKISEGKVNARILKSADLDNRMNRDLWMQAIFYKVNDAGTVFNMHSAVEKKDYKKLLDLLKLDLNEARGNGRYNREAKQRMNTYLDNELRRIQ